MTYQVLSHRVPAVYAQVRYDNDEMPDEPRTLGHRIGCYASDSKEP